MMIGGGLESEEGEKEAKEGMGERKKGVQGGGVGGSGNKEINNKNIEGGGDR